MIFLVFLPCNGALIFVSHHRPLTFGNQRPRQPVHVHAKLCSRRNYTFVETVPGLHHFQKHFPIGFNDRFRAARTQTPCLWRRSAGGVAVGSLSWWRIGDSMAFCQMRGNLPGQNQSNMPWRFAGSRWAGGGTSFLAMAESLGFRFISGAQAQLLAGSCVFIIVNARAVKEGCNAHFHNVAMNR